jgi:HAE1 family hydrophobic/amphiphilic exporter-1
MNDPFADLSPSERRGLTALFVARPVLTLMVAGAMLLVGVIAFAKLPLRFAPSGLTSNEINVYIPLRQGAMPPQEVEDKVVEPLEELLRTIPGIRRLRSDANSGRAFVSVELDEGFSTDLAAAEVRDRLQRARLRWPTGVDRYFTWREDASSVPLAFFQMLTPSRSAEWDFLMEKVVQPRLEAVDGVGRVEFWGLLQESVRIWFDRDKLVAQRIDYRELIQRLAADNFAEPVGEIDNGQQRFMLRVDSRLTDTDAIGAFPIRPGLHIEDIARIERVPSVRDRLSRYNQKYTYSGLIRATADANPVDTSARLRAATESLRNDPRLRGLEFRFLFDQGQMITESLETLLSTALQGGALGLLVLFLFLRNLRFTVAIGIAIPLAILMVGCWLFFAGDTLNILTMAGMTLAVGMVVDNSVVVLEAIRRVRDEGQPIAVACVRGAREVGLAVCLATLTTVVVLLPIVFMGGTRSRVLLGAVGIPLSVALIGSLVVALLLMPSGLRMMRRLAAAPSRPDAREHRWSPVRVMMAFNQGLLRTALRHRALAGVATVAVGCSWLIAYQKMDFYEAGGIFRRGDVRVNLELPRGLTLADVERQVIAWEDFLLAHKEEWRIDSVSSNFSRRAVGFDIAMDRSVDHKQFTHYSKLIEDAWPKAPGVKVTLSNRGGGDMGSDKGEEDKERNFVVRLFGRDSEHLMRLAQSARVELRAMPEVESLEIPGLDDNEEVRVRLDRDRIQELQVRPEVLMGMVNSGLQGSMLTRLDDGGRDTPLIAEFDSEGKPTLLDLKETQVFADTGAYQRLADLSGIGIAKTLGNVERLDGKTSVSIVGRRAEGASPGALRDNIRKLMDRLALPRGYSWRDDSVNVRAQQEIGELLSAMALGITLVFLLMGVLFESLILPGSILITIPFALFGAFWSLFLFYGRLDSMAFVGCILLCGIVVNNGIVLLDAIHRLRVGGLPREQAILEGTRRRLRPILMTATTTIVGLLPMALFGESGGGLSYVSMAIAVAGGLAFSTVFTAFVVPLTYTFMDDLGIWLRGVWHSAVAGPIDQAPSNANPHSL